MSDRKITQLAQLNSANAAANDLVVVVDVSDTSMAPSGTTKSMHLSEQAAFFAATPIASGTANGVAYLNGSKVLTTGSALTFDGTNLGVGGAASTKLHIQGTGTQEVRVTSNTSGDIRFGMDVNGVAYNWIDSPRSSAAMVFGVGNAEQMRLTSTGLGIGTSSPGFRLDVQSTGSTQAARFKTGGTGTTDVVGFERIDAATRSAVGYNGADGAWWFGTTTNHPIAFRTNNTERLRIDSSGNLIQTVNTTAATLSTNGTLTFSIVDDSTLRISVRGSDGTTRTATVALT
jgi:hypothetical protein